MLSRSFFPPSVMLLVPRMNAYLQQNHNLACKSQRNETVQTINEITNNAVMRQKLNLFEESS